MLSTRITSTEQFPIYLMIRVLLFGIKCDFDLECCFDIGKATE
jgi:hypothetical protein